MMMTTKCFFGSSMKSWIITLSCFSCNLNIYGWFPCKANGMADNTYPVSLVPWQLRMNTSLFEGSVSLVHTVTWDTDVCDDLALPSTEFTRRENRVLRRTMFLWYTGTVLMMLILMKLLIDMNAWSKHLFYYSKISFPFLSLLKPTYRYDVYTVLILTK